jgi:hypothetical protein
MDFSENPCNFLGDSFIKANNKIVNLKYVCNCKLVILLYTASWYNKYKLFIQSILFIYSIIKIIKVQIILSI